MLQDTLPEINHQSFLSGGGTTGQLIRSINWSAHPLGSPDYWPDALKFSINMMLNCSLPISINWGMEYFHFYNDGFLPIMGMNRHPKAMGSKVEEAYNEIWHIVSPLHERVMDGEAVAFKDLLIPLDRTGELQEYWFDFSYNPLRDNNGKIAGMLVIAAETTHKIKSAKDFASSAFELQAINEALQTSNTELEATQANLENTLDLLKVSEQKLDQILSQLSTPIAVFKGNTFITESANKAMLDFWHKDKMAVLGKPIASVFKPESIAPFIEQLKRVFNTGRAYVAEEVYVIMVDKDGKEKASYLDYIYQPVMEPDGTWSRILATAFDVTGKAESRKLMEENARRMKLLNDEMITANEQFHMAISTANLGTWSVDLKTNLLTVSDRARKMHGASVKMKFTLADVIRMILPEHKEVVSEMIIAAVKNNDRFETEYQIQPMDGSPVKWLRTTGKVYVDVKADRAHITGTIMDITERKLDELRKNDFISMVSHELKTPLTSLSAIVQIAQDKLKNDDDIFLNGAMTKAYSQVKRMTGLINGFLNVSRLESGKIHLDKIRFDIVQLTKEIIDDARLTIGNQNIILQSRQSILLEGDMEKIGSVITNLLSNGLKYSPRDSSITVQLFANENMLQASISDEGYGIDPMDKDRIFERYYRSLHSKSKMISGFGIGLYLSAEIINRHNGKIWVESEPGKGSTFYFQLPLQ